MAALQSGTAQAEYEAWIRNRLAGEPLSEGLEFKLYGLLAGHAHEIPTRVAPAPEYH